jgi:NAD(P)-dependent dehydrogenase (short-subunit alcohol dehydrogenase family)
MEVKDKVALVTGGASGLGEATVRLFVSLGIRVVIVDLNQERGTSLETELEGRAVFVKSDVSNQQHVQAAVDIATSTYGGLHIVVNCAGIGEARKTVGKVDGIYGPHALEAFEKTIKVNLTGTFNVIRLAAFAMEANELDENGERGVIINTASVAAYDGQIGQAAYSASKGGIVGMTLPIARDLARTGIRVMTIAPGLVSWFARGSTTFLG